MSCGMTDAERRNEVTKIVQMLLSQNGVATKMTRRDRDFITNMIDRKRAVSCAQLVYAQGIKARYLK